MEVNIAENIKKIQNRPVDSHKGSFGKLIAATGSFFMPGAAVLSGKAALRCGLGLLQIATEKSAIPSISSNLPEATYLLRNAYEVLKRNPTAILIGCGMGVSQENEIFTKNILENAKCSIILDADGITCALSCIYLLKKTSKQVILTPHIGEFSRISGLDIDYINANRQQAAVDFARKYNVVLALKGDKTIVTDGEKVYVNTTGNVALAVGGTGDVLAGMVSAFVCQKLTPFDALCLAVYLHGKLADIWVEKNSKVTLLPTDLLDLLKDVI
ncbi:MAG: NAD(P)H-hydrate dehydratase [Oscillospiraceae bacterium]|jgi:NAD(P)H-hydrate epimerase|nr:NAD(P)H-hydrate dehydratase [Oscillospiraceae bacterium]